MAEVLGAVVERLVFVAVVMFAVGGLYYLSARPRVTFLQAIFRWWVVLIGVGILVLGNVSRLVQWSGG